MDTRLRQMDRAVKNYDRNLFARREINGAIHVYRNGIRFESYDLDGDQLLYSRPAPYIVCALTTNWNVSGLPIELGVEVVLSYIREHDLDKNPDLLGSMERAREYAEERALRHKKSEYEAFARDWRRQFAKSTDDLIVSSTIDKSRREKWQL